MWGKNTEQVAGEREYGKGKVVWGKPLKQILKEKGIGQDFSFTSLAEDAQLDYIHRRTDKEDIYFVRNKGKKAIDVKALFRVNNGNPEIWNPGSGSIINQQIYSRSESGTTVPLHLESEGSVFVVFRKNEIRDHVVSITKNSKEIIPSVSCGKMVVFDSGDYLVERVNGQKKSISISAIPSSFVLDGSWDVRFPREWVHNSITDFSSLYSWTLSMDEDIKHFSGVASYRKQFELADIKKGLHIYLDLGVVKEVAKVYLNGRELGIKWHPPYRFDITQEAKTGTNYLTIEIANVLANRITGESKKSHKSKRIHSNVVKGIHAWDTPFEILPLHESGLLGPVSIKFGRVLISN